MRIIGYTDAKGLRFLKKYGHLTALLLIAGLSFWLNFYAISKIGYGNAYYAAAIKSMTQSFHNFFFVSFDPAGVVSVDKPPLGLWVQALFVLAFGYHGWAMLLPQALAGTASCGMLYLLTAKYFGRPAGLISSLVFALTPAAVVAARNNTMDMQLVLTLLVATWFLFQSIEKGGWRRLFLAALFVGIGFNIKMLQAYMILPAAAVVYLIFAKEKLPKRIAAGLISVGIVAVVSFAWVAAVDLTPATQRPYVGSSTNNTEWELIIGHNGMERIGGQGSGGFGGLSGLFGGNSGAANRFAGGARNTANGIQRSGRGSAQNSNRNGATRTNTQSGFSGGRNGGQGGGAGNDIGTAGALRFWESSIYGQISWLILLVFFCILAKVRKIDLRRLTVRQGVVVYWILWFAVMYAFFSFAGFWHRYYLCMAAPCIAGLAGIGMDAMFRAFRDRRGGKRFLLPASLLATLAVEIRYVWSYAALRKSLLPLMLAAGALSLVLMLVHTIRPHRLAAGAAAGCMLVSLLAAPFYWSLTVVRYPPQNSTMPYAGPELASQETVQGMTPNQGVLTTGDKSIAALESYLVAHYQEGGYLVVAPRADDVAQFIVDTGLPAVAYGGFLGSDNAMTLDQLKELVKEGKVTYFLATSSGGGTNTNRPAAADRPGFPAGGGMGGGSSAEILSYVESNAALVDPSEYGASSHTFGQTTGSLYLFDADAAD